MSNLQPNCCLEFDFRKVDQHAGGKWLIHDTKRRKDNQLQSLKLPCRISKLSSKMWHKGVRWHRVESNILKEGPGTKTSWCFMGYTVFIWHLWAAHKGLMTLMCYVSGVVDCRHQGFIANTTILLLTRGGGH